MAKYSTSNTLTGTQQNLSSSFKSLTSVVSSSATVRRQKVFDILVGTDGTPADQTITYDLSRQTSTGTGTAATPTALDPADAAALTNSWVNFTAEPTITATSSVFSIAVNQRASYRWVAAPGSELISPATSLNGFALRAKSPGYTSTAVGTLLFEEQ